MSKPKTAEEYVRLVDQALLEIDELRSVAEYDDSDEMGGVFSFIDALEADIRRMRQSMADGSYEFADQDLPFMSIVQQQSDRLLPFKYLLRTINLTHRTGLDVGE